MTCSDDDTAALLDQLDGISQPACEVPPVPQNLKPATGEALTHDLLILIGDRDVVDFEMWLPVFGIGLNSNLFTICFVSGWWSARDEKRCTLILKKVFWRIFRSHPVKPFGWSICSSMDPGQPPKRPRFEFAGAEVWVAAVWYVLSWDKLKHNVDQFGASSP